VVRSRLFGIETEFGCLVRDEALGTPEQVVTRLKDYAYNEKRIGLLDMHSRDYAFEPALCGGFLTNGGRLYIDAVGDHLEYATPEVVRLASAVAYDRAGHRVILDLVDDLFSREAVSFHNNSVDHFGGHTFGCHENYSVSIQDERVRPALMLIVSFLVTRQIYAGAGRVGGHRITRNPRAVSRRPGRHEIDTVWVGSLYGVEPDPTVDFQLSQRADHILHTISGRVRFSRALINPKHDTFSDLTGEWRLHVLFGEANMSEYATALKLGTTCLVLQLAEMDHIPTSPWVASPIETLRSVSRDGALRWEVRLGDGRTISAVDQQRMFLAAAKETLAGSSEDADWTLREWETVLDALESDYHALADRLDWVAKRSMLETFMEADGLSWGDEVLHSLDLEYHNIDPRAGLHYAFAELRGMKRVTTDDAIRRASVAPPPDTRARARGRVVQALIESGARNYIIDWDAVNVIGSESIHRLLLDTAAGPPESDVKQFCEAAKCLGEEGDGGDGPAGLFGIDLGLDL